MSEEEDGGIYLGMHSNTIIYIYNERYIRGYCLKYDSLYTIDDTTLDTISTPI